MEDLKSNAEITWCPGCGNFGILTAIKKAIPILEQKGIKRENIVMTAGIGCHAKIFDYLNLSGLYSLHGREIATASGFKISNPNLNVLVFSGDGSGLGEGLAHTLFAAKRNMDITMILHNNGVYALTTGQFSPLTQEGWKGPSTPEGSIEIPFNPISLIIEAGASFVARGFAGDTKHLIDLIVQGIEHEGFSFIEVLQPAVPYHNWKEYRNNIEYLEKEPDNFFEAIKTAKEKHNFTLGIFYRTIRAVYHKELYGNHNPIINKLSRTERLEKIYNILETK
jgi:2-oxoglutarate ferredoxin oxidoreductase subunit beta